MMHMFFSAALQRPPFLFFVVSGIMCNTAPACSLLGTMKGTQEEAGGRGVGGGEGGHGKEAGKASAVGAAPAQQDLAMPF